MWTRNLLFLSLIAFLAFSQLISCGTNAGPANKPRIDTAAIFKGFETSPVRTPEECIATMKLEEGFVIEAIAAEPLVNTPVAMDIDRQGRYWVVEMTTYMPDTSAAGEKMPGGKVVILEDQNGDGILDSRKVFLDSLVLPRAICLFEDGVLIAEQPTLWFVEIRGEKPGKRTVVDSAYAVGGNPEIMANGLTRGMDNWIYSSRHGKRYRKKGSAWIWDYTHSRGQWGLSQDDYGRAFYNNNSVNLLGDYFPPSFGAGNRNLRRVPGYNENIVPDNRVYPSRPTTGINRGYLEEALDDSLRLVNVTAACGPVVYRGGLFGEAYAGNVFVAEPGANLIKRNLIEVSGYTVGGRQAYAGREFLTSTDERFRPVTLYNGPGGALYVVDMYRGIIQHKTYLTDYLAREIKARDLESPIDLGRIYRIYPAGKRPESRFNFTATPRELAALFQHENGWVRDKAQQLLVDGGAASRAAIPTLRELLRGNKEIAAVHAFWTLEGLGALTADDLWPWLRHPRFELRMQAFAALPSVLNKPVMDKLLPELRRMIDEKDELAAPLIGFLFPSLATVNRAQADALALNLAQAWPKNEYIAAGIASGMSGREADFLTAFQQKVPDTAHALSRALGAIVYEIESARQAEANKRFQKVYPEGYAFFMKACQSCHGANGAGVYPIAPPLNRSEWVNGSAEQLAAIVLHGMTGPLEVNGREYRDPRIIEDMPGLASNDEATDALLAQVLSFIRQSWNNTGGPVTEEEVARARKRFAGREKQFTMQELKETEW